MKNSKWHRLAPWAGLAATLAALALVALTTLVGAQPPTQLERDLQNLSQMLKEVNNVVGQGTCDLTQHPTSVGEVYTTTEGVWLEVYYNYQDPSHFQYIFSVFQATTDDEARFLLTPTFGQVGFRCEGLYVTYKMANAGARQWGARFAPFNRALVLYQIPGGELAIAPSSRLAFPVVVHGAVPRATPTPTTSPTPAPTSTPDIGINVAVRPEDCDVRFLRQIGVYSGMDSCAFEIQPQGAGSYEYVAPLQCHLEQLVGDTVIQSITPPAAVQIVAGQTWQVWPVETGPQGCFRQWTLRPGIVSTPLAAPGP